MPSVTLLQLDKTLGRIKETNLLISSGFPYFIPEDELVSVENNSYQHLRLDLKIDGSIELGGFIMEGD